MTLESLAGKLRCTEGQLYSMVIAVTAATALVFAGGVPLGDPPKSAAVSALPTLAPAPVVVPAPTTSPGQPPEIGPLPLQPPVGTPVVPAAPGDPVVQQPPSVEPEPYVPSPVQPAEYRVPAPGAPRALTADGSSVYTGTDNGGSASSRLVVFSRTGDTSRQIGITGQAAARTGGLSAAAKHGTDVLATDRSRGVLLRIDPRTGLQQVLATLPDLPACLVAITGTCQPGAQDLPPSPEGLVVAGGFAYVADASQGTIWRYDFATKELTAWYSSSDFSSAGPSGLALNGSSLVFTVAQTADPAALLKGALYQVAIAADGTAGARSLLASFDSGVTPGPVAVGQSGVYVGLRGSGGIVRVSPTGAVAAIASATRAPAPGGLSLVAGTLYVADSGKPATATSGRILALPVSDAPAT